MLHEAKEAVLKQALEGKAHELLEERSEFYTKHGGHSPRLSEDDFQAIKVQLIALGLIQMPDRKRAVSDTATYWTLTPFGESYLMKLRALRRDGSKPLPTAKAKATTNAAAGVAVDGELGA